MGIKISNLNKNFGDFVALKNVNLEINKGELTALLKQRRDSANEIAASNAVLKQSLRNLLDLVPSSITLTEISMDKSSLIVKGTTPSRDIYNMLLATPLKSIFSTSNTSFYQLDNGWLNFVSTNKTDNLEGKNEQR